MEYTITNITHLKDKRDFNYSKIVKLIFKNKQMTEVIELMPNRKITVSVPTLPVNVIRMQRQGLIEVINGVKKPKVKPKVKVAEEKSVEEKQSASTSKLTSKEEEEKVEKVDNKSSEDDKEDKKTTTKRKTYRRKSKDDDDPVVYK